MARSSTYWAASDRFIADLQKDIDSLRATVRVKDDTIKDLRRQLVEKDLEHSTRVRYLEADLKFARGVADIHMNLLQKAIQVPPSKESTPITSTTRLRTSF